MKPSLPRFIYFTTEHGQYILCTEYPFVVGQVWKFTSEEAMRETYRQKIKTTTQQVSGYNILISFVGDLANSKQPPLTDEQDYFHQMSSFFLSRINERPMGWRRYKIEKL